MLCNATGSSETHFPIVYRYTYCIIYFLLPIVCHANLKISICTRTHTYTYTYIHIHTHRTNRPFLVHDNRRDFKKMFCF